MTLATTNPIFSGTVTASTSASMPVLKSSQDWIGIVLSVTAVTGTGATVVFGLQWSMDGQTWADADGTRDEFAPITAPCTVAKRFDAKAPYWRAYIIVAGATPSFTGSANAYN